MWSSLTFSSSPIAVNLQPGSETIDWAVLTHTERTMNIPYEATFTLQCVVNLETMPSETEFPLGGYSAPYLWVRPTDGAVGLANSSGDITTGTRWYAEHRDDGTVLLSAPNSRGGWTRSYLQRRADGIIGVTADRSLPGIVWKVIEAPDSLALQCVPGGADVVLLCGEIATGFVGTESISFGRTGGQKKTGQSTAWRVDNISPSGRG
jgi:hypothetical protein